MIPRILIIAGSDSGGGAGIQADIRAVTMLGGHAMTAVTAITAQNTLGVQGVHPVPPAMVAQQMTSVLGDIGVDAVKIGMIGSAAIAETVADLLEPLDVPIVFDPVMISTSGAMLADDATVAAFRRLMRIATVVTPNLPELAALGGRSVGSDAEALDAAFDLMADTDAAVLVKGGHADGAMVTDRLVEVGGPVTTWTHARIDTRHTHGTGCTLASGIAAGLAAGAGLDTAVDQAIAFVQAALAAAPELGSGHGPMGHALGTVPFHHLKAAADPGGWDAAAFAARWR